MKKAIDEAVIALVTPELALPDGRDGTQHD
jgi:hypothetical protein